MGDGGGKGDPKTQKGDRDQKKKNKTGQNKENEAEAQRNKGVWEYSTTEKLNQARAFKKEMKKKQRAGGENKHSTGGGCRDQAGGSVLRHGCGTNHKGSVPEKKKKPHEKGRGGEKQKRSVIFGMGIGAEIVLTVVSTGEG